VVCTPEVEDGEARQLQHLASQGEEVVAAKPSRARDRYLYVLSEVPMIKRRDGVGLLVNWVLQMTVFLVGDAEEVAIEVAGERESETERSQAMRQGAAYVTKGGLKTWTRDCKHWSCGILMLLLVVFVCELELQSPLEARHGSLVVRTSVLLYIPTISSQTESQCRINTTISQSSTTTFGRCLHVTWLTICAGDRV
jgi:hypothetical protein